MKKNSNRVTEISGIRSGAVFIVSVAIVFFISVSSLPLELKAGVALSIAVGAILFIYYSAVKKVSDANQVTEDKEDSRIIDEELSVLEEAAVFFSASIKQDEMLRLLETRLGTVLDNCSARIFRLTEEGILDAPHTGRSDTMLDIPVRVALVTDTAAEALTTKDVVRSYKLNLGDDSRNNTSRVAAVALKRADEVFCVLTISCEAGSELPSDETILAIAERITPLISGSVSFETSVANALRDSLTDLPNERAMYLLLENQVAEAQRFGSTRPLTVLAIDIRSFEEINSRFGHSSGDRLLLFASKTIKEQLRKMDMLARTADDEFIVVLPTADINSSKHVINRLNESFSEKKFEIPDGGGHRVELSYGAASFGEDGDTASKIVRKAIERKQVAKSTEKGSVIEFPRERSTGNS